VLLDCLTTLASNWLMQHGIVEDAAVAAAVEADLERELEDLGRQAGSLIVVSNEVGMGIVPAYPLGRLFRDLSGRLHQSLARRADAVYLMVAGLPVEVKALAVGGELYDGD
jgi:adenosylcobinamide kinase/adenosylcobinamide-phosphate guanylyltransferase